MMFLQPTSFAAKGFLKPPGATFSPADISNLALWLNADTLSLSNSDPVSTWNDSSANGWNATGSGSNRPTYLASAVNGKPAVQFASSSSQFLELSGGGLSISNGVAALTSVAVVNLDSLAADTDLFSCGQAGGDFFRLSHGWNASGEDWKLVDTRQDGGAFSSTAGGTTAVGTWYIGIWDAGYADGQGIIHANGGAAQASNSSYGSGSVIALDSQSVDIGRFVGGAAYFDGKLAQFLVYQKRLNNTEKNSLLSHFGSLYSISTSPVS